MTQIQQGDLLKVGVHALSDSGEGVARLLSGEGPTLFVPETAPGDEAMVRVVRLRKRHAFAVVQELLRPSPLRTQAPCILAKRCGGCSWQHIEVDGQQQAKTTLLMDALARIGKFDPRELEARLAPMLTGPPLGYRNRSTYPIGRNAEGDLVAGYYRKGSHRIVNANRCPTQDPRLDPLLTQCKRDLSEAGFTVYDAPTRRGLLRHLAFRLGRRSGEVLITVVTTQGPMAGLEELAHRWLGYENVVGVCRNIQAKPTNLLFGPNSELLAGVGTIREHFLGLEFQVGPNTFFQVNTEVAEALFARVLELLELGPQDRAIDAYCGIGTLTLPLARACADVTGIESHSGSVEQARAAAEANGITNLRFRHGAVEELLASLPPADVLILDPPRKGCAGEVIQAIRARPPKRLALIGCRPSSLARDLSLLCEGGLYSLGPILPADFFPQTPHLECAVLLHRN